MRILVTGGTGFLGTNLVPRLLDEGHNVFALTRSTASGSAVTSMGATAVPGDLDQPEDLSLPAVDAVVHAAALLRFAGPTAPYLRANVSGTQALLAAAQKAGAATFIYVSAAAVVMDGRGSSLHDVDESVPTHPDSFSGYIRSKSQGEAAVLAANRAGFRTIALRPPLIWGPGSAFSTQLPGLIESGKFAFIGGGDYPCSTVHVDNVVEAVQCALERGLGGQPYFIHDDETPTFREFAAALARVDGLSIDRVRALPYRLAFALGHLMELAARLRSSDTSDPALTRTMVRMIGREFTINDAAARRELGYVGATSLHGGLARMPQRA